VPFYCLQLVFLSSLMSRHVTGLSELFNLLRVEVVTDSCWNFNRFMSVPDKVCVTVDSKLHASSGCAMSPVYCVIWFCSRCWMDVWFSFRFGQKGLAQRLRPRILTKVQLSCSRNWTVLSAAFLLVFAIVFVHFLFSSVLPFISISILSLLS